MELKTSNLESKERAFDDSISDIKEDLAELDSVTNALPEIQDKVKIAIYHIFPNCMFAILAISLLICFATQNSNRFLTDIPQISHYLRKSQILQCDLFTGKGTKVVLKTI